MPYALSCTPSASRSVSISFPAPVPNASGHYDYYYKFVIKGKLTECPLFSDITDLGAATSTSLYFLKSGVLEVRSPGNSNTNSSHGVLYGEFNEYLVRHTFTGGAKERKVYMNGSANPVATHTLSDITGFKIAVLFPFGTSSRGGEIKTLQFVDVYGGVNKTYDADLSGGIGNILPPDGVQTGTWPSDDSEWIFYAGGTNYEIIPQPGSYTITGGAVSLLKNSRITPQAGSYALTGQAVGLLANRAVTPQSGSFILTGQSVQLIADRVMQPESGSYVITGGDVDLIYNKLAVGYVITPEPGLFSITGSDVALAADRLIQPESGNYQVFGGQVDLLYWRAVIPQAGAFAITGVSFDMLKGSMIIPQSGAYTITGNAVILDYSGFVRNSVYTINVSYAVNSEGISYKPNTETIAYKTNNVLIYYKPIEE